jgi:hypothetical protein
MNADELTYVDDGGVRYYRHRPEPVRAFEAVVNIGDRVRDLVLATPDGHHEIDIMLRAHREGQMQPVLRVHGQATPDGRLQVIVTNTLTGQEQVVEV